MVGFNCKINKFKILLFILFVLFIWYFSFSSDINSFLNLIPIKIYSNINSEKTLIFKDNKNRAGIYKFASKNDSSKFYIGSSYNLWDRISNHITVAHNLNIKYISLLYLAVRKYG